MIPLDLALALAPAALWACLWLADRMRHRSARRRHHRGQLLRVLADANRRRNLARMGRLPGQPRLTP